MARKRTKKEAKKRIEDLPELRLPLPLRRTPKGRAIGGIDFLARELGKVLVDIDPLDRLEDSPTQEPPLPTRVGGGGSDRPFDNLERAIMRREKAMQTIINTPEIKMTPELVEVINNDRVVMLDDGRLAVASMPARSRQFELQNILPSQEKPKRKRSKYNIELSRQLERLKKEKPRTKQTRLMKEAHKRTRKALGMPPKRSKR